MNKIKIFITGGTIDNLEYEKEEDEPKAHNSLIPELLKQARITVDYDCKIIMMKDSKFVGNDEREIILAKCRECEEDQVIITHGTMTMPDTAIFLGKQKLQKTIVLLGAQYPANTKNSDALFNLGAAITAVQIKEYGVYITMNGNTFNCNNVKKNMDIEVFEAIN